jgi:hypothetical protein
MQTPKDADRPSDEVRGSPELGAGYLGVAQEHAPHPLPLPASRERDGPITSAMGG